MAPLVSLTDVAGTIVLDWVKLADDGSDDLIVRLYEAAGGNAAAALRLDAALADAKASVQEVNLMEEPGTGRRIAARARRRRADACRRCGRLVGAVPAHHAAYSPIRDIGPRLDILGRAQP